MSVVWWIRRDLRLHDNEALSTALQANESVLPVFILDPNLLNSEYVGDKRTAFLFACLRSLDQALRSRGSRLIVRQGEPLEALEQLRQDVEYGNIVAERDHSPYAQNRDRRVGARLPLQRVGSSAIRLPGTVRKADDDPYIVYSPFRDRWFDQPLPNEADLLPVPESIATPDSIESDGIPEEPVHSLADEFPATEDEARRRLHEFCQPTGPIADYDDRRDKMSANGTSRLSPYLRFGLISPREAYVLAAGLQQKQENSDDRKGTKTWIQELIWRDFYIHILNFFPHARTDSFREKYRKLKWRNDETEFKAWQQGRTGYPVVDAAMRQLKSIGWMHNRARMVVASFLVKDLLIDWRWGERHFMQHLLDGDPASNNGGWQWAAGTGTDAAPYFRIFNPISQSEKHDPDGEYIRRWVPELADLPEAHIHEPWKMTKDEQNDHGLRIGEDYPEPIVDHSQARERALAAYRSLD